jgi:hypothetical protein
MLLSMDAHRTYLIQRWSSGLPEAAALWADLCADYGHPDNVPECAILSQSARLVVDWHACGITAPVAQTLASTEDLLAQAVLCGDDELRDLVAVCFVETVQNLALAGYADYSVLESQLAPHTRACWEDVERFWEGDAMVGPQLLQVCGSALRFAGHAACVLLWGATPPPLQRWLRKGRQP